MMIKSERDALRRRLQDPVEVMRREADAEEEGFCFGGDDDWNCHDDGDSMFAPFFYSGLGHD